MLTFSRVESEGLEATQQENIPALINRVLQLLAYRIRAEQITVNQQHPDDLPPIPIKVNSIQQVFLHVIGNAIDALHENPEKLISIESHVIKDSIEIVVSDNGPGIPSENLQKIFDPFYTTKVVGEGTGLGLSVSKRICQQHGGDIECESEAGIGTKFKVILPIKRDINKYKEEV